MFFQRTKHVDKSLGLNFGTFVPGILTHFESQLFQIDVKRYKTNLSFYQPARTEFLVARIVEIERRTNHPVPTSLSRLKERKIESVIAEAMSPIFSGTLKSPSVYTALVV